MPRVSPATSWLCDLDGVLIDDGRAIPGAAAFLQRLGASGRPHLILTNNSMYSPARAPQARLSAAGLDVDEAKLWTSALATAQFVAGQRPGGAAFAIGEASLHEALRDVGYRADDQSPDYVILGETQHYSFDAITTAIRLVSAGRTCSRPIPSRPGPRRRGRCPRAARSPPSSSGRPGSRRTSSGSPTRS